jgi:isopentenyl-diphosphate Delta-isomerase
MEKVTPIGNRKSDHIRINLDENVQSGLSSGLENYHFVHRAVPELNLNEIDSSVLLFGKILSSPILISSMTGGTDEAARINQNLAVAAQQTQIALGVGSQRIAIEHPDLAWTFQVRSYAPDVLLFANLGAVQLNYGYGIEECKRAVEMIEANALILHFNCLQEAIQQEGNTNFSGLINKIESLCKDLPVPIIAKEVGWGFSTQDILLLIEAGVSSIDIAGSGGTSWSQVEMYRAQNEYQRKLAEDFSDWGIPTVEVIQNIARIAPNMSIIASGGLRSGVDIAKCVALGASVGGMASPFLKSAAQSVEATINMVNLIKKEIRICMFATGSKTIAHLRQDKLIRK